MTIKQLQSIWKSGAFDINTETYQAVKLALLKGWTIRTSYFGVDVIAKSKLHFDLHELQR